MKEKYLYIMFMVLVVLAITAFAFTQGVSIGTNHCNHYWQENYKAELEKKGIYNTNQPDIYIQTSLKELVNKKE